MLVNKGQPGYDPLFKVAYPLKIMMAGIGSAWQAGQAIAIDESMIKYAGKAVSFVQYMPAKPIKHGLKMFVCACAYSAVILSYELYVGSDKDAPGEGDWSAKSICLRLIEKAGLTGVKGRVLYTDNWYTSIELVKDLWNKYRWRFCGTMTPTDKKDRQDHDVPFLKLSNGAIRSYINRGWFREAVVKIKAGIRGKVLYVQHTSWRDKKQVCFLSSNTVGSSKKLNLSVKRSVKGAKTRAEFAAPMAQADYVQHFDAIDRQDRDSADWSTSIRTDRYYLRIFFWLLDRVIHAV